MSYVIGGEEKETDDYGFLLEPDFSDEAVQVIAEAEGIVLTDNHLAIISYFRDKYRAYKKQKAQELKKFIDSLKQNS